MPKKIAETNKTGSSGAAKRLTEREKTFCALYVKSFNGTQSYMKAYGETDRAAACRHASNKLRVKKIQDELARLKKARFAEAFLTSEDIMQKYIEIAFADVTDFVDITDDGQVVLKKDMDGTIIQEISVSTYGTKIKLPDRMAALNWLAEHIGMLTDEQHAKVEKLKAEAKNISRGDDSTEGGVAFLADIAEMPDD